MYFAHLLPRWYVYQFAKLFEVCADWLQVQSYPFQRRVPARWWLDVTILENLLFNRRVMELALMKNEALVPDAAKKLDWDFMEAVLAVLKPLAEATRTVEAEQHPTIGLVLEVVALLRKQIAGLLKHENGAIRAAARNMSIEFGRRWVGVNSLSTVYVVCTRGVIVLSVFLVCELVCSSDFFFGLFVFSAGLFLTLLLFASDTP